MAHTVTAMEVRNRLGDLLSRASYAGEKFIIERRGKPVAVLMSLEDYQCYVQLKEAGPHTVAERTQTAAGAKNLAIDEALATIQKALQEVRVRT